MILNFVEMSFLKMKGSVERRNLRTCTDNVSPGRTRPGTWPERGRGGPEGAIKGAQKTEKDPHRDTVDEEQRTLKISFY